VKAELPKLMRSRGLVGRAPQQVMEFLRGVVDPALRRIMKKSGGKRPKLRELDV
jgi:hypothetical protein